MIVFRLQLLRIVLAAAVAAVCGALRADPPATVPSPWKSPLVKKGKLGSPLVEVTPFVFKERLYLLENWQKFWELPNPADGHRYQEDQVRIRDVEADKIVSVPLVGHGLGMALVVKDRVYVFTGDWGTGKKWHIKKIDMTWSEDLVHWSKPATVLEAQPNEHFFNVSVCRGDGRFVLLVETDDPRWPAFTFKYFVSENLTDWKQVPQGLYGTNKYVGGPALYYEGGTYYTLYLESLGGGRYETRITRSKDLVHWEDAPKDRPFVSFDPKNLVHPIRSKTIHECNASDAEVVYWRNKTLVYFTGGDQHVAGDLQLAEFQGTPRELFELYFQQATDAPRGAKEKP
jgi:alpha-L-fucosidase